MLWSQPLFSALTADIPRACVYTDGLLVSAGDHKAVEA